MLCPGFSGDKAHGWDEPQRVLLGAWDSRGGNRSGAGIRDSRADERGTLVKGDLAARAMVQSSPGHPFCTCKSNKKPICYTSHPFSQTPSGRGRGPRPVEPCVASATVQPHHSSEGPFALLSLYLSCFPSLISSFARAFLSSFVFALTLSALHPGHPAASSSSSSLIFAWAQGRGHADIIDRRE